MKYKQLGQSLIHFQEKAKKALEALPDFDTSLLKKGRGDIVEWVGPNSSDLLKSSLGDVLGRSIEELGLKFTSTERQWMTFAGISLKFPLILMLEMEPSFLVGSCYPIFVSFIYFANKCVTLEHFLEHFDSSVTMAIVTLTLFTAKLPSSFNLCDDWTHHYIVIDEDDLIFPGDVHVRFPAVDGLESGKQGPHIAQALMHMLHVNGFIMKLHVVYGCHHNRLIASVLVSPREGRNDPTQHFILHEWLLLLGAVMIYPNFLVGEDIGAVHKLWTLQTIAFEESVKIKEEFLSKNQEFIQMSRPVGASFDDWSQLVLMREQWNLVHPSLKNAIPRGNCSRLRIENVSAWYSSKAIYTVWLLDMFRKDRYGLPTSFDLPLDWFDNFEPKWDHPHKPLSQSQRIGYPWIIKLQDSQDNHEKHGDRSHFVKQWRRIATGIETIKNFTPNKIFQKPWLNVLMKWSG